MSFNNVTFILHKPQLSENIGACARSMKNFNFNKLAIVDPKPIYPNDKILATSVGAKDVIKKRFGIDEDQAFTLEEIGKEFNVTRERIRQIELKALKKLKKLRKSPVLSYLD